MKEREDEWYIKQLRNGDEKALEFLFRKYYYSLCHFAGSFVKSTDLSDEIVTDVFLNIWQLRESLQIRENFKAYLFIAVKNRATNTLIKGKIIFEDIDSVSFSEEFATPGVEADLSASEIIKQVETIIEQLPAQRKMVFILNRLEGFRYKEIADILNISVSTVQKQMTEAVKYMSQYKSQFLTIALYYALLFSCLFSL